MGLTMQHISLTNAMHALAFATSLSLAFLSFDKSLFGWHPFTMSIAYLFIMAEGLLMAVDFRSLDGQERVGAINAHAAMQLRAVVLAGIGGAIIIANKIIHNKHHFQSLHAKAGLATLIMTVAAPLGGAISFRRLGLIHRFPERWHPGIKRCHRLAGAVTWFMALVTIELTLPHKSVHKAVWTPLWQVSLAVMALVMALLLIRSRGGRSDVLKAT